MTSLTRWKNLLKIFIFWLTSSVSEDMTEYDTGVLRGNDMVVNRKKARITVTIDMGLLERLKNLAELRGGNVSAMVEECVTRQIQGMELLAQASTSPLVDRLVTELTKPKVLSRAMKIASMCAGKDVDPDEIDDLDKLMGNVPTKAKRRRA